MSDREGSIAPADAEESGWISVKERLPEPGRKVLAFGCPPYVITAGDRRVIIETLRTHGRWTSDWTITHWHPIPPYPDD